MDIMEVDLKTFLDQRETTSEKMIILLCDKENA